MQKFATLGSMKGTKMSQNIVVPIIKFLMLMICAVGDTRQIQK